jgi:HAD superfamily hydrolase (TIGR01509 family)
MLLFDLDGTLIDSNGVWRQVDVDFLARRGIPWTEEYNQGVMHATLALGAAFTKEFCHLPESEEAIMQEWLDMVYVQYAQHIPLKPYVRPYLEACAAKGLPMAIYTSCEPALCQAALTHHDLCCYFQTVFYASTLGVEKRSPEGFRIAARQLSCAPEEITFFDDSPLSCAAAKGAGLVTVGVWDPLFAAHEAEMRQSCHRYIRSFQELL